MKILKKIDKQFDEPLWFGIYTLGLPSILLAVFWFLGMPKEEVMGIWLAGVGLPLLILLDVILDP